MPSDRNLPILFPQPATLAFGTERLRIAGRSSIIASESLSREADLLRGYLNDVGLVVCDSADADAIPIVLSFEDEGLGRFGEEGYYLRLDRHAILLQGATPQGVARGIQTVRQLLLQRIRNGTGDIEFLEAIDRPVYAWRGLMLDVSRHFFTVAEIKSILDVLALHKINIFHWHLTDDGGWRAQIDAYPNLTERGAWRTQRDHLWDYFDIEFPHPGSNEPRYGGFYTKDQLREVVAYASERHIQVVPEIDLPGHCLAACASYPELVCDEHARTLFARESKMSGPNVLCAGKETTYAFAEAVLSEIIEIFPSDVIHVGGDEVSKILWKACSHCRERMRQEGLGNEEELQSYFIRRLEKFLNAHGRRLMGWDEILEGGLAPNALVMSWRGTAGGIAAAREGHQVVMTPTAHCYLDYDHATVTVDAARAFDPRKGLSAREASMVVGGQGNLWTEYVPNLVAAQQRIFPRLAGIAEALWHGCSQEPFAPRLAAYLDMLKRMGVSFYQPDTALVGAYQEGVMYLGG